MAFIPINPDTIQVGDPITKELFDIIKANFDDLDERANSSESGGAITIINGDVSIEGLSAYDTHVYHHKVIQDCLITDLRVQLFSKEGIAAGNLKLDLQKSVDTNPANFNSILTAQVDFNFAVDAAYSEKSAAINPAVSAVVAGNVLRLDLTSIPAGFSGRILVFIGAE